MPLIWKTRAENAEAGPCETCRAMNGKRDGEGWNSTRPAGYNATGDHGPPPMHEHCACTVQEETAEEWSRSINAD
jgi:hypothetical protein